MPQNPTLPAGFVPDGFVPDSQGQVNIGQGATFTANGQTVEPSLASQVGSAAVDVGKGALKGLASSAIGAGQMVTKVPGVAWGIDHLYGLFGMPVDTRKALADALLQPEVTLTNAAQKVGKTIEQVGEFFALPTGKAGLVSKMATQGIGSAVLSGVQGATAPEAGVMGAVGAAMPAAGALASQYAPALREGAEKLVNQALGPTKERFKAMAAKVAPGLLDRDATGWFGASRQQLLEKATAEASTAGKAVDAELSAVGGNQASTDRIVQALEDAKQKFNVTREMSSSELASRPDLAKTAVETQPGSGVFNVTLAIDKRPIEQLSGLQKLMTDLGPNATIDQVVAVRRVWDDIVARAGGYAQRQAGAIGVPLADQTEAWAKAQATKAIRQTLESDAPSLADVNKEFAFWTNLRDVLKQTQSRTAPQSSGLGKVVMTAAGSAVGASQGASYQDKAMNAALGGLAANQITKAFTSPRWALIRAKFGNELAEALASNSPGAVRSVAAKMALGLTNQAVAR